MIALAWDCLLFRLNSGESIPYSADMISVELTGESARLMDPDVVREAAKAVFHYFKYEEQRQTITMGEFAGALEKVLHGIKLSPDPLKGPAKPHIAESDLRRLARVSGKGCELFFFPLLRNELREQMSKNPRILRFKGLRSCVKQLAGVQRWSSKCQTLQQQIVAYLRECLSLEARVDGLALVVE